ILIKPVLAQLSGIKNLIIIPDDELHYIPFEALQDEQNNYLISHFAIQYIYSASLIQKTSIKGLPDSILSFA
ncbi:MAG: CHAT domain-containing protein, partial [Chitinophagaceae bacterium]|nr:CHAT domain-containing protein [Chitinophagaceae bacterium]